MTRTNLGVLRMPKRIKPELQIKLVAVPRREPDRERLVRALVEVLRMRTEAAPVRGHDGPREESLGCGPQREDRRE